MLRPGLLTFVFKVLVAGDLAVGIQAGRVHDVRFNGASEGGDCSCRFDSMREIGILYKKS
jgi:hypothetical protein